METVQPLTKNHGVEHKHEHFQAEKKTQPQTAKATVRDCLLIRPWLPCCSECGGMHLEMQISIFNFPCTYMLPFGQCS